MHLVKKKVLVTIEDSVWSSLKARAAERQKTVSEVAEWAFRMYLSGDGKGSEVLQVDARSAEARSKGEEDEQDLTPAQRLLQQLGARGMTTGRGLVDPTRAARRAAGESGSQVRDDEDVEPEF